jgi:predicted metal-dependent peptidase
MHKTTNAELDYFESRVRHWIRELHLGDWKVEVFTESMEESATCEMWHSAHGAHIRLNAEFKYRPSKKWLDRLALHEVGHILLCDLKRLIFERQVSEWQAETVEHAVIRRLETALK